MGFEPMPAPTRDVLWIEVCCDLDPGYVSEWCGHGFKSHSQPFLQTYPGSPSW